MQPGNPVVGSTILRRPAIQSPNFVTGVSGWIIRADGTFEFNGGQFRGPVIIGTTPPTQGTLEFGLTPTSTPPIPAVLTGFNADYTWFEANLRYISTTDFFFEALVFNSVFNVTEWITGIYTVANGVQIQTLVESTANTLNFGTSNYDTVPLSVSWRKTNMTFQSDVVLVGDPAASITTGPIGFNSGGGVAEAWQAFAFAASWSSKGGGFMSARYRRVASPPNCVQFIGAFQPGTKTDGTQLATMPAAYRPQNLISITVAVDVTVAGGQEPHFDIGSNGAVVCWGCALAGTVIVTGLYPLDLA